MTQALVPRSNAAAMPEDPSPQLALSIDQYQQDKEALMKMVSTLALKIGEIEMQRGTAVRLLDGMSREIELIRKDNQELQNLAEIQKRANAALSEQQAHNQAQIRELKVSIDQVNAQNKRLSEQLLLAQKQIGEIELKGITTAQDQTWQLEQGTEALKKARLDSKLISLQTERAILDMNVTQGQVLLASIGGVSGITFGGVVGFALGGPIGGPIGAVIGGAAWAALGAFLETDRAGEAQAKRRAEIETETRQIRQTLLTLPSTAPTHQSDK